MLIPRFGPFSTNRISPDRPRTENSRPPRLATFCVFYSESRGREFVDFWFAADHSDNNQRTLKTIYLGNRCSIRLSYGTKENFASGYFLGTDFRSPNILLHSTTYRPLFSQAQEALSKLDGGFVG